MEDQLPEVRIRRAAVEDADPIAAVHVASWREAYAQELPAEYLAGLDVAARARTWRETLASHGSTVLVAEDQGRVVGFASFGPARDEDAPLGAQELYAIYLEPSAWGHGIARDLMRTVVGHVGEDAVLTLWVLASNDRARHFYRRHGFQPDGVEHLEEIGGTPVLEVRYRRG